MDFNKNMPNKTKEKKMKRINYSFEKIDNTYYATSIHDHETESISVSGNSAKEAFWNLKDELESAVGEKVFLEKV